MAVAPLLGRFDESHEDGQARTVLLSDRSIPKWHLTKHDGLLDCPTPLSRANLAKLQGTRYRQKLLRRMLPSAGANRQDCSRRDNDARVIDMTWLAL